MACRGPNSFSVLCGIKTGERSTAAELGGRAHAMNERDISRALAEREQGQCEVQTPAGFIDVLTPTWVYEVKAVRHWKAALGQIIAYARYYPKHKPALYLFGTTTPKQRALIREHCAS